MMKKYFKLPFKLDYCKIYIKDDNSKTMFNWLTDNDNLKEKIINILNSPEDNREHLGLITTDLKKQIIYLDKVPILCVRGWGYLTGVGGCKLEPEKAI